MSDFDDEFQHSLLLFIMANNKCGMATWHSEAQRIGLFLTMLMCDFGCRGLFPQYGITEDFEYNKTFPTVSSIPLALPVFQVKLFIQYIRFLGL